MVLAINKWEFSGTKHRKCEFNGTDNQKCKLDGTDHQKSEFSGTDHQKCKFNGPATSKMHYEDLAENILVPLCSLMKNTFFMPPKKYSGPQDRNIFGPPPFLVAPRYVRAVSWKPQSYFDHSYTLFWLEFNTLSHSFSFVGIAFHILRLYAEWCTALVTVEMQNDKMLAVCWTWYFMCKAVYSHGERVGSGSAMTTVDVQNGVM